MREIKKYKSKILAKSGLSAYEFDVFLALISAEIEFVPYSELEQFVPEAKKITPDPNDTEYFSLALKLKCSIWSNDKKLKTQNKVQVYSTEDLIRNLK